MFRMTNDVENVWFMIYSTVDLQTEKRCGSIDYYRINVNAVVCIATSVWDEQWRGKIEFRLWVRLEYRRFHCGSKLTTALPLKVCDVARLVWVTVVFWVRCGSNISYRILVWRVPGVWHENDVAWLEGLEYMNSNGWRKDYNNLVDPSYRKGFSVATTYAE